MSEKDSLQSEPLKKFRIFYFAEVEAQEQPEAEIRVETHKHLLQYWKTEELDPQRSDIEVDIREYWDLYLDIKKLKIEPFYDIDETSIIKLYENRATNGVIFKAGTMKPFYSILVYVPRDRDLEKTQAVVCIDSPTMSTVEAVLGKLIGEDLKNEPNLSNPSQEF